jgi:hypothetical protein
MPYEFERSVDYYIRNGLADEPCVICGKDTGERAKTVMVTGGGVTLMESGDDPSVGETLGQFPIGPECLRRLPKSVLRWSPKP